MANLKTALTEVLDLVEHLVSTHVHWNVDLSKDEAVAKVGAARVALLAADVEKVAHDAESADLVALVADSQNLVKDAQSAVQPVTPEVTPNV